MLLTPLLGHAGGWDEMLAAAGAVFLLIFVRLGAERRRQRRALEEGSAREKDRPVETD